MHLNQVAKDHQLLKTARDYFQFVTNFFEVINVSATHVYHSALELSPLSSIIRKHYYSKRPYLSPRVITGIKESWGTTTAGSTKHSYYLSSTWSPCGQLVAVVADKVVEIWDALTLRLFSTLHSTDVATKFRHGIAYSPDGHSLAACSSTGIIIWDSQTGGEVTKIKCEVPDSGLTLVWSLDGKTIGAVSRRVFETISVHTYHVTSGIKLSTGILQLWNTPYLWAHEKSFQIATMAQDHKGWTLNIFEVGSTLTKIESFPLHINCDFEDFSPAMYRALFSIARDRQHDPELLILNVKNSEVLLQATGSYWFPSFSPDANIVAASTRDHLLIWKYTSGKYIKWREFQQTLSPLQFSPTSSSILSHAGPLLHVLNLDQSPTASAVESTITVHSQYLDAFSPHGTFIVTGHPGGSTMTITNLNPQNPFPSQFIDTDLEISSMVLTGNVLLVTGSGKVVAWLLTEEGVVDGMFGNTRADHNDSLWEISPKAPIARWHDDDDNDDGCLEFSIQDEIAVIYMHRFVIHAYHTGTGEIISSAKVPKNLGRTRYRFHKKYGRDDCNLYHHSLCKHQRSPECEWPSLETTLQEGWVKDPEGKHRLWVHPYWRTAGNDVDWLYNATTLRLRNSSDLLIVKF